MKFYFNGCSHTFGDDLTNKSNAWPYLVANNYNADCFNDGISGGTNDSILYNTLKNIDKYDKFYIAWTYVSRFTRYRSDNNHDVNFNVGLVHQLYENNSEFINYGKLHYSYWFNELYAFKLWLQQIILLQNTFKQNNKPYKMIFLIKNNINEYTSSRQSFQNQVQLLKSFDITSDKLFDQHFEEIQNYVSLIDDTHLIDWNSDYIEISKLSKVFATGKTNHLLEDGHRAIAEYIIKHDSD